MTFAQFLLFMIVPIGGLGIGYLTMRKSQQETERFDKRRDRHAH